jgi:hypothetical protein
MMTRRVLHRLGVAVALSGALTSTRALAQGKPALGAPTAADVRDASHESEVAGRLFAQGVYEAALPHFQKAYALARKPADLQKVAESFKALGRTGDAYDAYFKLVVEHANGMGRTAFASAKKALAELETTTGTLEVHAAPDGALVRVGGRVVGVTPLAATVRLPAGSAQVEIEKEGFEPFVGRATIDPAHAAKVDAQLVARALTGHLAVTESHAGSAHLLLDGKDAGPLPWEGDLDPGVHELALQSSVLRAAPQSVKVARGARVQSVFVGDFTASRLHVVAHPDGADIAIDGKSVGTGSFDGEVSIGEHRLLVSLDHYKPSEKPVTVVAQAAASEDVVLERLVTPEELAAAREKEDAEAIRGGYGQVAVFGVYPAASTQLDCGEVAAPSTGFGDTCSKGFVLGGGLAARGGYSFGVLGLELVGIFMANHWENDVTYASNGGTPASGAPTSLGGVAHDEAYSYTTLGGMVAAGPRLMTSGRQFRVTLGVAGGLAFRDFQLGRSLSNGLSESPAYSGSALAVSPAVTGDLGLIIGSTPGLNFVLGAMAWVEVASTTKVNAQSATETTGGGATFSGASGPFTVESGAQVYVGPYLGVRFGH